MNKKSYNISLYSGWLKVQPLNYQGTSNKISSVEVSKMDVATKLTNGTSVAVRRRPTLARRVSEMFKDGNYSGPPLLFRHSSMQKIRHCCQNLNLFPYLLYSFGNSKSHPVARKVNLYFNLLLKTITEQIFFVTNCVHQTALQIIRSPQTTPTPGTFEASIAITNTQKFTKFEKQERKRISLVLTLAVYFALLVLAFQLVGLCSLMMFGKYTPGFIFLISALMCLGYVSLMVMIHDGGFKKQKRKFQ
ncbi:uncharacterized protein LOC107268036 isoform X2 [Cephus cinctus]|uniref:Uncharacterized protein LOC107268036 isoform X2 n=1 Tax=Cephus cinctus TaxID=211228 RepID=A0AAJ7RIR6_CEPCN|nr:uncharacterized protein LOC107268036 isoform X2 [Cephus cinctus]